MNKRQKFLFYVVPTCVSGVFLLLALRRLDLGDFLKLLGSIRLPFLLVALVVVGLNSLLRAFRWRTLLVRDHTGRLAEVFWAMMVGYLGNSYLPARIGEFLRAYALGKKTDLSPVLIFSTALVERVFDTFFLVGLGWLALRFLDIPGSLFFQASQKIMIILIAFLVILLFVTRYRRLANYLIGRLPVSDHLRDLIARHWETFNYGLTSLHNPQTTLTFFLCTVLIWSGDVVVSLLVSASLGLHFNLPTAYFLNSMLGLSSAIPATPGSLGVFQFVAVAVLTPLGFNTNQSLAFILIFQMIGYLHITVFGLLGIWKTGIGISSRLISQLGEGS
ncbi:MAG: lysylphosphatidylglycerol synthase transmembrane domain-containing protein [Acidobacteriota bacterium]